MFKQFKEKAFAKEGINENGAALWAKYFYLYRDKMWREQRTKFIFVITESDLIEMVRGVDHGFSIEFAPIYVKKQNTHTENPNRNDLIKKLINEDNKRN